MKPLRIVNMKPAAEWEPYRRLPRALVRQEHWLSPCDTCSGECCEQVVDVSAVEAARIALTLVLPFESFVGTRSCEADVAVAIEASHAVRLDEGLVRLTLRRQGGDAGACAFLHRVGGRGRCVAYAVRPGVCRMYPYAVEEEDGARLAVGSLRWCPSGWLYDDDTERAVAASLAAWRDDLALDAALCARWNEEEREDRSFAAFARFAVHDAAPRLGLDVERLYPPERRAFNSRVKAHMS